MSYLRIQAQWYMDLIYSIWKTVFGKICRRDSFSTPLTVLWVRDLQGPSGKSAPEPPFIMGPDSGIYGEL